MGAILDLMKMEPSSSAMDFSETVKKPSYKDTETMPKGVTAVWDEESSSLKAVPNDRVKAFADAGYKVGTDAQLEALNNSPLAKLGAAATTVSNTASMGGFNALLAATGQKGMLKTEQQIQEANPGTTAAAGVATEVGLAGLGAYNPLVAEGTIARGLGVGGRITAGTKTAKLATWLARGASGATMGAGQAQVRGMADEYTREKVLGEPVSVEKMASSGLSELGSNALWGAGLGVGVGVVKAIRPATGNLMRKLEQAGALKANMVKDAEATAARGWEPTRVTLSENDRIKKTTKTKLHEDGYTDRQTGTHSEDNEHTQRSVKALDDTLKETKTNAEHFGKITTTMPIYEQAKAGAIADAQAATGVENPIHPADTEFRFQFPDDYSTEQKQSFVRKVIKERLADNPAAAELWNENAMLEAKMQDIANGPNASARNEEFLKLQREKEAIKQTLTENVQADIGPDGVARPSFEHLNREYARASGNPFVDLTADKVTGKPTMPKSRAKAPKAVGKTITNSGEDTTDFEHLKRHTIDDEREFKETRTKAKEDTYSRDYKSHKADEFEENHTDNAKKWSVTYVAPKRAPEMKQVGYQQPFKQQTVFNTSFGLGMFNHAAGAAVGGGMEVANALTWAAGHHEAIGKAYDKVIVGLARKGAIGVRALQREESNRGRQTSNLVPVDLGDYPKVVNFVNAASTNPDTINQYLQATYPNIAKYHPEVLAHVGGVSAQAVSYMQDQVAKKPFDPTLQNQDFKPPRAQQVRLLRTWAALCNPEEALRSGDPQAIAAVQQVFPNLHSDEAKVLSHEIATHKTPITGRTARNLSRYLGANVRPIDDPAALKRLQETGGLAPPPANGNPKPSGGGSKASSQAAMRDQPDADMARVLG